MSRNKCVQMYTITNIPHKVFTFKTFLVRAVCGGNVVLDANTTQYIGTPGYGDNGYSDNMNCTWSITGPQNSFIIASFEVFMLEEECRDKIDMTDGKKHLNEV